MNTHYKSIAKAGCILMACLLMMRCHNRGMNYADLEKVMSKKNLTPSL